MKWFLTLASLLLPLAAWAQHPYQGPAVQAQGKWNTGNTPVIQATTNALTIKPLDYGAFCDGTSHPLSATYSTLAAAQAAYPLSGVTALTTETDTAALNQAIQTAASTNSGAGPAGASFLTKSVGRTAVGTGSCLVNQTLNLTSIKSRALVFDFGGSTLLCGTFGTPCVDMTGAIGITVEHLSIVGDSLNSPNIGLLQGRYSTSVGSTYNVLYSPTIDGVFTFAPYVNVAGEDNTVYNGVFSNSAPNAYAMVLDGQNYWTTCSLIAGVSCITQYTQASFNSFNCMQCKLLVSGAGSSDVWMSRTSGDRFIGGYFHDFSSGSPPAVIMDFSHSSPNRFDTFDVHMESGAIGAAFRLQGAPSVTVDGLVFKDHSPQVSNYLFQSDTAGGFGVPVTAVTLENADLRSGALQSSATWWDNPSLYTVSGVVAGTSSSGWTLPGAFSGTYCFGASCTTPGTVTALPTTLTATQVAGLVGSVTGIVITNGGTFSANASPPSVIIAPPPSGTQATAAGTTYRISGYGAIVSAGTGYSVGDILTFPEPACSISPAIKVLTVAAGGAINTYQGYNSGVCTVYQGGNTTPTGGTGSGAVLRTPSFKFLTIGVTNAGAGYTVPPAVTFSGSTTAAAYAQLSSSLLLTAGGVSEAMSAGGIVFNSPIAFSQGAGGAVSETVSAVWAAGNAYQWGNNVNSGPNLYLELAPTCTAATGDAPTATSGQQTTGDGCTWLFLQAGASIQSAQFTDAGVVFPQCIGLGVAETQGQVEICSGTGTPAAKVTAPVGSIYTDASNGNLWMNTDSTSGGWVKH